MQLRHLEAGSTSAGTRNSAPPSMDGGNTATTRTVNSRPALRSATVSPTSPEPPGPTAAVRPRRSSSDPPRTGRR
ncbi:MAG: hypothetical protein GEU98_18970 [Pseudonocardiaceae bacterium]|nr:hypothetical protein [Pseudonocardiaceae bacterium]